MHEGSSSCCGSAGMCKCPHHKAVPLFITLIGVTFLLQAFDVVTMEFSSIAWPVLLTLIGVMKLTSGMCKCCGPSMSGKM